MSVAHGNLNVRLPSNRRTGKKATAFFENATNGLKNTFLLARVPFCEHDEFVNHQTV
jgi:hypothetical protein